MLKAARSSVDGTVDVLREASDLSSPAVAGGDAEAVNVASDDVLGGMGRLSGSCKSVAI